MTADQIAGKIVYQGKGVSVNLLTEAEVREAYRISQEYRGDVLVERYIEGDDYRLSGVAPLCMNSGTISACPIKFTSPLKGLRIRIFPMYQLNAEIL